MASKSDFKNVYYSFYGMLCLCVCFSQSAPVPDDPLRDCGLPDCMVLDGRTTSNVKVNAHPDGSTRLFTFCYRGSNKEFLRLWINPKLSIIKTSEDQVIALYPGYNLTQVKKAAKDTSTKWFAWWIHFVSTPTMSVEEIVSLDAFNVSCMGITSKKPYNVEFKVKNPEIWLIIRVLVGILLIFWAPVLSRNVMMHYTAGVSVGVLASILLVTYIFHRFLPKHLKSVGLAAMLTGGSVSLFALSWISSKIQDLVHDHWQYVLGYVLVTGLISFAVVYRYGPIKEPRSLNLLQWLLQLLGVILIYNGTQISEASIAIVILVISSYFFPVTRFTKFTNYIKYRYFPAKQRLLTEEEYILLKERETEKALEELRSFCKSPQCDSWKVISKIKSPSRFASFVEGEDHLSEDEFYNHNAYSTYLPSGDNGEDEMSEIEFRLTSP